MAQREKDVTDCEVPETHQNRFGEAGILTPTPCPSVSGAGDKRSGCVPSSERAGERVLSVPAFSSEKISRKRPEESPENPTRYPNRCQSCRKRVGLTGFRCRCGDLFCGEHRYSDRHVCSFDYKAVGKEAIARENPVVKAAKIIKI
ncbi:hypothetical protein AMTRI_Chr03g139340 [Amborella trichopoda]|uniref:AN1-type domain-containing protein n=1 Tax=Amborella trichopoda TaxID=13333 RepID=W1PWK5_AMBTC|nr:zinc finger A20 and AN1 domain-containing stress-associated protein 5 [Amborella trichopoda]ERN11730.1 hypothetical protein AMTR_s00022p00236720 [Amborella trichopoda]|eukprot:XP_006850149.1 zinc finger A20 and AN1 domain-containing stress-associated protein 5 [Amborella trichopoda]